MFLRPNVNQWMKTELREMGRCLPLLTRTRWALAPAWPMPLLLFSNHHSFHFVSCMWWVPSCFRDFALTFPLLVTLSPAHHWSLKPQLNCHHLREPFSQLVCSILPSITLFTIYVFVVYLLGFWFHGKTIRASAWPVTAVSLGLAGWMAEKSTMTVNTDGTLKICQVLC